MHTSAMKLGSLFFEAYSDSFQNGALVIDLGALNLNGSLKEICPSQFNYVGVDLVHGSGVDIVLEDPYQLPFQNESIDIVISTSVFEHADMFWLSFLEIIRVLKPNGLFYLNVPSNGNFHRTPIDCWRFYPDSGVALINWARRNNYNSVLIESFIGKQEGDIWNDFVAVFLKDERFVSQHADRIINHYDTFTNGTIYGRQDFINLEYIPEDVRRLNSIK